MYILYIHTYIDSFICLLRYVCLSLQNDILHASTVRAWISRLCPSLGDAARLRPPACLKSAPDVATSDDSNRHASIRSHLAVIS